jgi:branched-chain amino acid aminotransferase
MRVFDGGLFRARDHMARFVRSARAVGLAPPDPDEVLGIICEVVRRSDLHDAHVRPIVTRGFGGPGIDPRSCDTQSLIVSGYPFPPFLGAEPIRLMTSAIARKAPRSRRARESLNYLDGSWPSSRRSPAGWTTR